MKDQKKMFIPVVHSHAAGIDAGSRSHFVSVGQEEEDVREFGVYHHWCCVKYFLQFFEILIIS